ncbi:DUF222 domain-containing protein [Mycolicibacterium sp. 120270]|uniref:DUF222 domain-containing protein n=1 Tax=Mycolicibacterium sp. 120270 TaxID=3090600 RepID=UPI00299EA5F5|nr:DUF222 domain-containing protein [Mycolicibacterium sp. 120270]MDX1882925.1 DUF222 domain-containing protein [Mycolicibacterium sp. 120270]
MFDHLVSTAHSAPRKAAVGAWVRVENAACARRLSAIADVLEARLSADGSADRDQWCLANWNAVACAVAAQHGVSLGVASHQLMIAMALRERLPRLADVFAAGQVSFRVVSTIVTRTGFVKTPEAQAKIDAEIAAAVTDWGVLSKDKIETAVDDCVERYDPWAVRRTELSARNRHVTKHPNSDGSGTATLEAVLFAHDAEAVDARLDAMAATVCDNDPRTLEQRRADALGALGHGVDRLACLCNSETCPAAGVQPNDVVINAIAEEQSLTDDTAVVLDGQDPDKPTKPLQEMTLAEAAAVSAPTGPAHTAPAAIIGGPILPAALLAAKVAAGAKIRYITHPGDAPPEPHYRPSAKLEWFVRCRDMTCRFPGCREPADVCDLDHTIAYPIGPTCASNLKCFMPQTPPEEAGAKQHSPPNPAHPTATTHHPSKRPF